jgi:nitroimidazol reductase NimA-like FMN-containing flavoprotein (pyridoxamine 5'-phosphate oxidase superfamily)
MMSIIIINDKRHNHFLKQKILLQKDKIMFGDLSEDTIEVILRHQLIGHIACYANELTYVVPISYAYESGYVYAHTHEGMKISMMRQNPKVCFAVHTMENMANWQSVVAWGDFEEITDAAEREKALKILLHRNLPIITSKTVELTPNWPFVPKDLNSSIKGIVFRIRLNIKTGKYESREIISY